MEIGIRYKLHPILSPFHLMRWLHTHSVMYVCMIWRSHNTGQFCTWRTPSGWNVVLLQPTVLHEILNITTDNTGNHMALSIINFTWYTCSLELQTIIGHIIIPFILFVVNNEPVHGILRCANMCIQKESTVPYGRCSRRILGTLVTNHWFNPLGRRYVCTYLRKLKNRKETRSLCRLTINRNGQATCLLGHPGSHWAINQELLGCYTHTHHVYRSVRWFWISKVSMFQWTHCWQLQTQKWSENNPLLLIFNWMEAASIILANYIYLEVSDWTWFASPYTVAVCFLAYVTVVQKVYANSSTAGFFLCHRISCQSHPVVHQKSGLNNTWKMLF